MSKLGYSATGYEIIDEEITIPAGSGDPATAKVSLAHDTLIATGLSVTVEGTPLVLGADYDLLREDYSVRYRCYRQITFYSNFEATALVTYTTLGDYIEAGDLNSLDERLLAVEATFYDPGELIDRIEDLEDDMYDAVDGIKPRTEDVYDSIFAPVSGKKDVMDDIQPFITNEVENFTENYLSAAAVAQLPQDCKHGVGMAGVVSGRTWINVLGTTGANIAADGTVSFTSMNEYVYYDALNNSKITGDGGSKTITNSGSSAANVMVIDLTTLGALMPEEAATATILDGVNTYSVEDNWDDLPETVLAQMTPTYIGGIGSANMLNGVVVDLQIIAYSPSEDEVHASESVGAIWDSSSDASELLSGAIVQYPVLGREYPLLSLNGYRNEYQPDERMFVKKIALGDVTIATGSGTFTGAVGTGNCRLYSTSNWKAYSGMVSGNTVTTTAADGTYLLEYQLETEQVLGTPATEITVLESGTLTPVTVELSDVGIYIDGAVTIEVAERPIVEMVACSSIDLETGNLLNVLDKVTVAANGLSFTVEGAEAGDYFDYTYTHDTVNNLPLIIDMGIPLSFHGRLTNLNVDISTTQKLLRDMSRTIMALGQFVQTYIPDARTVLVYPPTPIVHHGFMQEPDITIYGQTILNEIPRTENFHSDTDDDGMSDYFVVSEELDSELNNGQRIYAEEVTQADELIFSPNTQTASAEFVASEEVNVNRIAGGVGTSIGTYEWEAGEPDWTLSGRTLVNLIRSGEDVPDGEGRYFKSVDGNTYIDLLNATTITGDNTYTLVENDSGSAADIAVYNLTALGYLTESEADRANTLAGEVLYSTSTLWEDVPAAIVVQMLNYIAPYTKESKTILTNTRDGALISQTDMDIPALSLKEYKNTISSDGTASKYVWLDDFADATYTHIDESGDYDYVEVELDAVIAEEIEDFDIGVVWDYSSDDSGLDRNVQDIALEVLWDYSSDSSDLSRRNI